MFAVKISLMLLVGFTVLANSQPLHGVHARRSHKNLRRSTNSTCKPQNAKYTSSAAVSSTTPAVLDTNPTTTAASSATITSSSKVSSKASSSTKVSSSKTASSSAVSSSSSSGLIAELFPITFSESWSTADGAEDEVPLSDATFNPTNLMTALSHNYVTMDGKSAMQAHFDEGSYRLDMGGDGGISFYAPGPSSVDLTTAKEATFGYSVFFEEGFEFNKGGKLPGLFGGDSYSGAVGCSGGSRDDACFSARLMWRTDGAGEMYTYLPPSYSANDAVCDVAPYSDCNDEYGASVARGSFSFKAGEWTTISERVRLNTAGQADGELQLWANGESVLDVKGLVLIDSDAGRIRGIQMQTFFGGSTSDWASPQDQSLYFADFSTAITETL